MALTSTEEAQTRELLAKQAALLSLAGNETTITSKLGATKVNLSQLPSATAIADADLFLIRQGTTDKGVGALAMKAFVPTSGRLIGVRVLTASATYTPTAGMVTCVVEVQGGGGAGGGSVVTAAAQYSRGGGGGSGAYACGRFTSAQVGASLAVTIGAGGVAASGVAGGAGGTTSFGALMSAPGGGGGATTGATSSTSFNLAPGGDGGAVSAGGLVNEKGSPGLHGFIISSNVLAGIGAASKFGGGGYYVLSGNGVNSTSKGAGGGGASSNPSEAAFVGGTGGAGLVIVWEYA